MKRSASSEMLRGGRTPIWRLSFIGSPHAAAARKQPSPSGTPYLSSSGTPYHCDPYHDLGANYFDARGEPALTRHLARRLMALGYEVHIDRLAA
jgi:hypothetical protein